MFYSIWDWRHSVGIVPTKRYSRKNWSQVCKIIPNCNPYAYGISYVFSEEAEQTRPRSLCYVCKQFRGSVSVGMFFGILDPDPWVRGADPDPPNIKQKKIQKKPWSLHTGLWLLCDYLSLLLSQRSRTKIAGPGAGTGSGSFNQMYVSADPDPYQNVTDPQPCLLENSL